jgi:hypothetical protein
MWSFFSKDPAKDLTNYDLQEQVTVDRELEERSIWTLNNAKKKGGAPLAVSAPSSSTQQASDLFSSFSYVMKPGNESWVCLSSLSNNNLFMINIIFKKRCNSQKMA